MHHAQSETVSRWAEVLAAGCFLNALLREWQDWRLDQSRKSLTLPLKNGKCIRVHLEHYSIAGRHRFGYPYELLQSVDDSSQSIGFTGLVKELVKSDSLWPADSHSRQLFIDRVFRSVENSALALQARKADLSAIYSQPTQFQQSEQALLGGHSVHPTPKSRDQFSEQDAEKYIPEFDGEFQLHWFSIDSSLLADDSVHEKSFADLTVQLAEDDPHLRNWLQRDTPLHHTLLPAHPWQARKWLENSYLTGLLEDGRLISYGTLGSAWRATSSVRAVHARHASYMLKYSLSLKLTNSIRHLLPKEVIRGKEIHEVKYRTATGKAFRKQFSNFDVITEPAHAAIKGPDGEPMAETMIVFRENPFQASAVCDGTELLATLTQDNPDGDPRVVNIIRTLAEKEQRQVNEVARSWFAAYFQTVVKPLIGAQSQYGLLFGAHQQNLLVHMPEGYPQRAWFRDCQGTGYSQLARELLGIEPDEESETEHYVEASLGNRLFTYYLLINSTFGVLSAIGSATEVDEAQLLSDLRRLLKGLLAEQPKDTSCLEYMLNSPELWSKGNFYCTYSNFNENTMKEPLGIYHTMANPLYQPENEKN